MSVGDSYMKASYRLRGAKKARWKLTFPCERRTTTGCGRGTEVACLLVVRYMITSGDLRRGRSGSNLVTSLPQSLHKVAKAYSSSDVACPLQNLKSCWQCSRESVENGTSVTGGLWQWTD